MLLAVTRNLPPVKGAGWLANKLKAFYNRKSRPTVIAEVLGFELELEPAECVDGGLLFYPHLYDRREFTFLQSRLPQGKTFVDVGANVGIYSLVASQLVGNRGRIISIEADPYSSEKLIRNVRRNNIRNIEVIQIGVSDRSETLLLHQQTTGNRGGSTFVGGGDGVPIDCLPLLEILENKKVSHVAAMKIDIEGFEEKVLRAFFENASLELYPRILIVEFNPTYVADGKLAQLLLTRGYMLALKAGLNRVWVLDKA